MHTPEQPFCHFLALETQLANSAAHVDPDKDSVTAARYANVVEALDHMALGPVDTSHLLDGAAEAVLAGN